MFPPKTKKAHFKYKFPRGFVKFNACQKLKMTKANENDPAHGYKAKRVDAEKESLMVGYEWLLPSQLI